MAEQIVVVLGVLPLLVALAGTRWLRNRPHGGEPLRTIHQVAYLAGGPDRVTDTAVAAALERQVVRLDKAGVLRRSSARPADPFAFAVSEALPKVGIGRVRGPLRASEPMRSLRAELLADGLALPEGRLHLVWRAALLAQLVLVVLGMAMLLRAVVVTGQAALLAGSSLIVATTAFAVTLCLDRAHRETWTTKAGELALSRAREDPGLVTGVTGAVALGGLAAHPDRRLTRSLLLTPSRARDRTTVTACGSYDGPTTVVDDSPG
ncbi:TIGR04222 domain-containing membrane protein [Amycolatopsis coloradensis]|uniref:TIGR04222 domain-containing membrane protein n=1 Tax=Amycolatopsis coloradensis TaxID=76021 RepID=A0ACD5BL88_9PSEU